MLCFPKPVALEVLPDLSMSSLWFSITEELKDQR